MPRFDGYDREHWESLDESERGRLRSALREIWTDPQVISAREEVQQASDAYRRAVREAMARVDPSASTLLREMQSAGEGRSRERLGSAPPGPRGRPPGIRPPEFAPVVPPGFLDRFPQSEQERFRRAEAKAQRSEQVESTRRRFAELREQDEELRKSRFEAHLEMRKALFEAIVSEDPGLKEMIESLEWKGDGPRDRRGGGKRGERGDPEGRGEASPPE